MTSYMYFNRSQTQIQDKNLKMSFLLQIISLSQISLSILREITEGRRKVRVKKIYSVFLDRKMPLVKFLENGNKRRQLLGKVKYILNSLYNNIGIIEFIPLRVYTEYINQIFSA